LLKLLSVMITPKELMAFSIEGNYNRILYIRTDRIGDMVLTTPVLRCLKQQFPQADIVVLTSPQNYHILDNNPNVKSILIYNRSWSIVEKIKFITKLRKIKFDLSIDPFFNHELHTAIISYLSGAKMRTGYECWNRGIFFNTMAYEIKPDQHFIDTNLEILRPLVRKPVNREPELFLNESEKNWTKEWLKNKGIVNKTVIGIHPGGHYITQRWPAAYFAELIRILSTAGSFEVILFGGTGDRDIVQRILENSPSIVTCFISGNIRKFISLLSSCDVFVCNNSGPLHIAVAMHIPTVSTMGPTVKERWWPIGDIHKVLRIDQLSCIGCNSGKCKIKTHDCMRMITPLKVVKEVFKQLNNILSV